METGKGLLNTSIIVNPVAPAPEISEPEQSVNIDDPNYFKEGSYQENTDPEAENPVYIGTA